MNKIAIQIQHDSNFYDVIKEIAEVGFKFIAVGFGSSKCFHNDGWKNEILRIKEAIEQNGLECIQTHAPYYDLLISAEVKDADTEKALARCIEGSRILGADICAFHPRSVIVNDEVDEERSFEENYKDFGKLLKAGEENGVKLGIENLPMFPGLKQEFYSCHVNDHIKLIDSFNSRFVCGIWDFGHSHLMRYNEPAAIAEMGRRIEGTHVHNNHADNDWHLLPNDGTIDWAADLSALYNAGYKGYLTLEVNYVYDENFNRWCNDCYNSIKVLEV